ncbi:hypothetical protein [uncultured Christiangramia sp.]|uniref:hypothetical protein n=1 Tax=uncultured Christiangramia sp. TaxID=503836 RepID=UPI0025D0F2CD|nr:hypothetical protein [uncultured Christiangramia sp.]
MKYFTILYLLLFLTEPMLAQNIDFKKLEVNGQSICSSKSLILEKFGEPLEITNPDYECGFLSSPEQMKEFESIVYKDFVFTGNREDDYILDEFKFNSQISTLKYGGIDLNKGTTIDKLQEIFGKFDDEYRSDQSIYIFIPNQG